MSEPNWTDVIAEGAIAPDEFMTVEVDGVSVIVANVDGDIQAIENNCPHDHVPMDEGGCIQEGQFVCPWHGAKFCMKSGDVTEPPAFEGVAKLPTRIENGRIQVRDDRWD